MWSRNLLIASVVVFLATTISTAPVEEKEPEEIEVEDGEEELSEEEEGMRWEGGLGKDEGVGRGGGGGGGGGVDVPLLPAGHKLNGDSAMQAGPDRESGGGGGGGGGGGRGGGGGDSHTSPYDPSSHDASLPGHAGSSLDASIAGQMTYYKCLIINQSYVQCVNLIGSMGQAGGSSTLIIIHEAHPQPAGIIHYINETEIESPEYDTPESPELNEHNYHTLLGAVENGPAAIPVVTDLFVEDTTHMDPTGAMDPLGASSHLDNTGECPGEGAMFHAWLLSGGVGDPYASDIHIDISDHTGMTSQLDSIAVGLDPGPALSSSSSPGPDVAPGLGDHIGLISDFTGLTDYSGPDHPYLSSGFDGSYHSAGDHAGVSDTTDHPVAVMSHTDYSSSHIDHPGNGRQSQVTDTHGGDHAVNDVHHDVTAITTHQSAFLRPLLPAGEHGVVSHHDDMGAVTDEVAVQRHDDVHTVSPQTDTTGKAPKKVQQAPGPSPKVDSAAGLGHHQYRACSGMAAGRCECICTHSEGKTFGGWPGVKKGSKEATSLREEHQALIFCKRYRDWTAEDWGKVIFSDESPFPIVWGIRKKACQEKTK
uniref:Si:ch211-80h18.1 n=1 Tax=Hucho hucho TaxID=62062 RepID=A0A4W5MYG4_9TELE